MPSYRRFVHRVRRRPGDPVASRTVAALLAALAGSAASVQAQPARIEGQVVDAAQRRPVVEAVVMLAGTSHSALTGRDGNFRIVGVRPGTHRIRVSHVAYGEHTETIEAAPGETVRLRIAVSANAISLEPIDVQAMSRTARAARAAGARTNVVTRAEIVRHIGTSMTLADVLRQHVAGVRVRTRENLVGQPTCIEFRASLSTRCRSPAVFLDGVRVSSPTILYEQVDLRTIESMEVVPAAEAGVRFGPGALNGALLIQTRRPGTDDRGEPVVPTYVTRAGFDWSLEPAPHPRTRVFVTSLLGSAAGLAVGVALADRCIALEARDRIVTRCDGWTTLGVAAAAVALPALGGGLAARFAGGTERSHGRLLPAAAAAGMVLVPGYAAILSGQRSDSDFLEWTGRTLVVVGVPLAVTVADRLFRRLR